MTPAHHTDGRPGPGRSGSRAVYRAEDRAVTSAPGRTTRHSFSFGQHYDPGNVAFGALLSHNDDRVGAGHGYDAHPHRDLEILTWVLAGGLRHEDSTGTGGLVVPGLAQRLTAGSGVVHTERNADARPGGAPVRFVQMWVRPDEPGLRPSYEQQDVTAELGTGGWVLVASGRRRDRGTTAVRLHSALSALHAVRLAPGASAHLPDAPLLHVFVARGGVRLQGVGELGEGDAARLRDHGGARLVAAPAVTDLGGAEVLAWALG